MNRVGEKFITNQGLEAEIIEYFGCKNCTIRFLNDGTTRKNIVYSRLVKGEVANLFHPSMYGIGCIGEGKYKSSVNYNSTVQFSTWSSMLGRCYNEKLRNKRKSYEDCTVCKEWHNFQNFAKWFDENYVKGFELDKDILVKGNKIYSPETCCFVPSIINTLFVQEKKNRGEYPIGVRKSNNKFSSRIRKNNKSYHLGTFDTIVEAYNAYKENKEIFIKELALQYKNALPSNVYDVLINYKI